MIHAAGEATLVAAGFLAFTAGTILIGALFILARDFIRELRREHNWHPATDDPDPVRLDWTPTLIERRRIAAKARWN